MRMKLLHFAPKILAQSNTLQGRLDMKSFEKVRINNRTEHMLKGVTYYEFFAIIEMVRIKIVVREVFGQEKIFWSIIPYWRYSKNRQRKMYHGNPKED